MGGGGSTLYSNEAKSERKKKAKKKKRNPDCSYYTTCCLPFQSSHTHCSASLSRTRSCIYNTTYVLPSFPTFPLLPCMLLFPITVNLSEPYQNTWICFLVVVKSTQRSITWVCHDSFDHCTIDGCLSDFMWLSFILLKVFLTSAFQHLLLFPTR